MIWRVEAAASIRDIALYTLYKNGCGSQWSCRTRAKSSENNGFQSFLLFFSALGKYHSGRLLPAKEGFVKLSTICARVFLEDD